MVLPAPPDEISAPNTLQTAWPTSIRQRAAGPAERLLGAAAGEITNTPAVLAPAKNGRAVLRRAPRRKVLQTGTAGATSEPARLVLASLWLPTLQKHQFVRAYLQRKMVRWQSQAMLQSRRRRERFPLDIEAAGGETGFLCHKKRAKGDGRVSNNYCPNCVFDRVTDIAAGINAQHRVYASAQVNDWGIW